VLRLPVLLLVLLLLPLPRLLQPLRSLLQVLLPLQMLPLPQLLCCGDDGGRFSALMLQLQLLLIPAAKTCTALCALYCDVVMFDVPSCSMQQQQQQQPLCWHAPLDPTTMSLPACDAVMVEFLLDNLLHTTGEISSLGSVHDTSLDCNVG
jgi:hypothetical protein